MRTRSRFIAHEGVHLKKNPLFAHLTGRLTPERAQGSRAAKTGAFTSDEL